MLPKISSKWYINTLDITLILTHNVVLENIVKVHQKMSLIIYQSLSGFENVLNYQKSSGTDKFDQIILEKTCRSPRQWDRPNIKAQAFQLLTRRNLVLLYNNLQKQVVRVKPMFIILTRQYYTIKYFHQELRMKSYYLNKIEKLDTRRNYSVICCGGI